MKKVALLLVLVLLFGPLPAPPAFAGERITASTPLSGSTRARLNNIQRAADAIDGARVGYGEAFSFNDLVGPRTSRYGYESAINGRGVKVIGGGVAQVASTIYLALKQLDGIEYEEKKTYGNRFNGKYVEHSRDAILVDYDNVDFRFINEQGGFDIELWIERDRLYCALNLRGKGRALSSASFETGGNRAARINIALAADSITDTALYPGDEFSFNELVGPRTSKYGYVAALNGRGAQVTGGGVAQVASAVWMAVKNLKCVRVLEKSTYGAKYNQDYVQSASDAILTDYVADIDFRFRYTGDGMMSIYAYVEGRELVCDIYESFE